MDVTSIMPKQASNVTPEIIAAWQKAYPRGVFELSVKSDDLVDSEQEDGKVVKVPSWTKRGWVRKPTREEMKMLSAKGKTADPISYSELALDMIWLGGDEDMKTDDDLFFSIIDDIQKVIETKESEIKKL